MSATPTAQGAHEVLIGIGAILLFVMVGVMLAGFSDPMADAVLAFFVGLVVLQLLTNASVFEQFLSKHPYITSVDGGQSK